MLTVTLVIEYQLPLIKIGKVFFNPSDGKDLLVAIYRRERAPVWCLVDDDSLSRYLVFIMRRGSVLTTHCTSNPLLWLIWTKVSAHIIFFLCLFFLFIFWSYGRNGELEEPVQSKFNIGDIRYFVRLVTTTDRTNKWLSTFAPVMLLNLSFASNKQ